jgi:DNA-binding FrmR family transcriptional regulator
LDRAGFKVIASGLEQCLSAKAAGQSTDVNLDALERMFLSLA